MGHPRAAPRHSRQPTARTAELLGLEIAVQLPAASHVELTKHAVDRYRQRVDRELSRREAARRLHAAKAGARVYHRRPRCLGPKEPWEYGFTTVGYVMVERHDPLLVLPVVMSDGKPVAVTCIVPG